MTAGRGFVSAALVLAVLAPADAATAVPIGAPGCLSAVRTGVIPAWARGGFNEPKPRMPHVLGRSGRIVALLFAYPLLAPPPRDHNNKILWVARKNDGSSLRIRAQRMVGSTRVGAPVSRTFRGGPGPSFVNFPKPGCWRLTLRWSDQVDSLDLQYRHAG